MTHVFFDISKVCGENRYTNYIVENMSLFLSIEDTRNPIDKIKRLLSSFSKIHSSDPSCLLDESHAELHTTLSNQFDIFIKDYKSLGDSLDTSFTLLALAFALNNEAQIALAIKACVKEITAFINKNEKIKHDHTSKVLYIKILIFIRDEQWLTNFTPHLKHYINELLQNELETVRRELAQQEEIADKAVMRETQLRINWLRSNPPLTQSCFDDISYFSSEYLNDILHDFNRKVINGAFFTENIQTTYMNVEKGERKTAHTPSNDNETIQNIYILGSSTTFGWPCEDAHTIASHLQLNLNKTQSQFIIKAYAINSGRLDEFYLQLKALDIKENDIILCINQPAIYPYNENSIENVLLHLYSYCQTLGARFYYFMSPRLHEIVNPSKLEQVFLNNSITDIINNKINLTPLSTKFYEEPKLLQQLRDFNCTALDLQQALNRPHAMGEIYVDGSHISSKGNKLIADYIYANFFAKNLHSVIDKITLPASYNPNLIEQNLYKVFAHTLKKEYQKNESISAWLQSVQGTPFPPNTSTGAIVMNCNPFTNGHLFLIEYVLAQVDNLYIFIVEENFSDFTFDTRLALVKAGTQHLPQEKIKILPSGNFIISAFTFPEYFQKANLKTQKVDPSEDIAIFGAIIAPALNITKRFIGEEPHCNVTSQYNTQMKALLPKLGVAIVEIPRKEIDSKPISASRVRRLLETQSFEELKSLVPPTTYDFLVR